MYIFIYRLELSEGKIYIGMTKNPKRRLKDHRKARGSIRTMNEPINEMDIIWKGSVKNKYHALLIENTMAKKKKQENQELIVYGGELSDRYRKTIVRRALKR